MKKSKSLKLINVSDYDDVQTLLEEMVNFTQPLYIYPSGESEELYLISNYEIDNLDIDYKINELNEELNDDFEDET